VRDRWADACERAHDSKRGDAFCQRRTADASLASRRRSRRGPAARRAHPSRCIRSKMPVTTAASMADGPRSGEDGIDDGKGWSQEPQGAGCRCPGREGRTLAVSRLRQDRGAGFGGSREGES
jgi:hypothetical protein